MEIWAKEREGSHWTERMWRMCILGSGLAAEFAPALWIPLLPELAPLGCSSITPTKPKISPSYPKGGNLWSLYLTPEQIQQIWVETGDRPLDLHLLPYYLGCQRPLTPRAASASPKATGGVPAPPQEVLHLALQPMTKFQPLLGGLCTGNIIT